MSLCYLCKEVGALLFNLLGGLLFFRGTIIEKTNKVSQKMINWKVQILYIMFSHCSVLKRNWQLPPIRKAA